jgi:hypothetical protein
MNIMFRMAGIVALFTTIVTIISRIWGAAPSVIHFIAQNSPFFYGVALGIGVAGLTRNLWLILIAIGAGFVLLKWVGL